MKIREHVNFLLVYIGFFLLNEDLVGVLIRHAKLSGFVCFLDISFGFIINAISVT